MCKTYTRTPTQEHLRECFYQYKSSKIEILLTGGNKSFIFIHITYLYEFSPIYSSHVYLLVFILGH